MLENYMEEDYTVLAYSETDGKAYAKSLLLLAAVLAYISVLVVWNMNYGAAFKEFLVRLGLFALMFPLPVLILSWLFLGAVYENAYVKIIPGGVEIVRFTKEIFLPISSITAISVNNTFFNTVTFTAAGKVYRIAYMKEAREIYEVLQESLTT
ncbi:MAG: hypothetical protein IJD42_01740 [Clostridia bacterium]|nr:hypothetical protein [Clostridia bacterium]